MYYCKDKQMQCANVSHETGECLAYICRFDESDDIENDCDYEEGRE